MKFAYNIYYISGYRSEIHRESEKRMIIHKASKKRLCPNTQQVQSFAVEFGHARFV
jgi:uncharacterized membrane protein YdfJ with MMPL/SSD domain